MVNFLISFIYIICFTGTITLLFKKTFGKCLPLTFMLSAFIYYFSQLFFQTFKIGFVINIALACIFPIIIFYKFITHKKLKDIFNNFFSQGFYCFIIIYIFVFIYDFNRTFTLWDEFSHWGLMVKEMIRLDKFYSIPLSNLAVHKDYPPIMQLMQLFFTNLHGSYKESYLINTIHLFAFSLFIPSISENTKKFNKCSILIKSLITTLIIISLIFIFDNSQIFNTIYLDCILALIIVYLLTIITIEKDPLSFFNIFSISLTGSFIILTKQIGICFYAMALFLFIGNLIIKKYRFQFNKENILKFIKIFTMLILIPLLVYLLWNNYVKALNLDSQFSVSDFKFNELIGIIKGSNGEAWQYQTSNNFRYALIAEPLTYLNGFSFSYFQIIILSLILLYIIYRFNKEHLNKNQIFLIIITLIIGALGYAFVMLVTYIFSFGEVEGPILASFNRYMSTYTLICILYVFSIFNYFNSLKDTKSVHLKTSMLLFAILVLLEPQFILLKYIPEIKNNTPTAYENQANIINNNTKENAKIFIISQEPTNGEALKMQYYLQYYINPRQVNFANYYLPTDQENIEQYFNDNIKNYLFEFDYLYLASINNNFTEEYKFLFKNDNISQQQLYKIINNNGILELQLVN